LFEHKQGILPAHLRNLPCLVIAYRHSRVFNPALAGNQPQKQEVLAAWQEGWVGKVVKVASEPFYFDQGSLTRQEWRDEYERLRSKKGANWNRVRTESIRVQTARELKEGGDDISKDRIALSCHSTADLARLVDEVEFMACIP
jgi:hypothetical protein